MLENIPNLAKDRPTEIKKLSNIINSIDLKKSASRNIVVRFLRTKDFPYPSCLK